MADNESAWGIGESFLASGGIQIQGGDGNLHKPMYQLSQDGEEADGKQIRNDPSALINEASPSKARG